uniref:Uncharacterized protein n=1 Tax=Plectus sambesii TaxID=2011161 RepID=A0A914X1V9_9BILA
MTAINWDRILMGIISVALLVLGVAACLATGGLAIVIGAALISGGISGLAAVYSGASWSEFAKSVGCGLLVGALSGVAAPLVGALAGSCAALASHTIAQWCIHLVVSMVGHALITFVTNGIQNLFLGQDFTTNWKQAVVAGAFIGAVSTGMHALQKYGVDKLLSRADRFLEQYIPSETVMSYVRSGAHALMEELGVPSALREFVISRLNDPQQVMNLLQNYHHHVINAGINAATQYIMTGDINLLTALFHSCVYGTVNSSIASRSFSSTSIFNRTISQIVPANLVYQQQQVIPPRVNIPQEIGETIDNTADTEAREPVDTSKADEARVPPYVTPVPPTNLPADLPSYDEAMGISTPEALPITTTIPTEGQDVPILTPTSPVSEPQTPQAVAQSTEPVVQPPAYERETTLPPAASHVIPDNAPHANLLPYPTAAESATPPVAQISPPLHMPPTDQLPEATPQTQSSQSPAEQSTAPTSLPSLQLPQASQPQLVLDQTCPQVATTTLTNNSHPGPVIPLSQKHPSSSTAVLTQPCESSSVPPLVPSAATATTETTAAKLPLPPNSVVKVDIDNSSSKQAKLSSEATPQSEPAKAALGEAFQETSQPAHQQVLAAVPSASKDPPVVVHEPAIDDSWDVSEASEVQREQINQLSASSTQQHFGRERNDPENVKEPIYIRNIDGELRFMSFLNAQKEQEEIRQLQKNRPIEIHQYNSMRCDNRAGVDNNFGTGPTSWQSQAPLQPNSDNLGHKPISCSAEKPSVSQYPSTNAGYYSNCQAPAIKPAIVFPLIIYNDDVGHYQIYSHELWPKLPDSGLKMVTVSGAHASGRTTFIHQIAYELGYGLQEEQVLISRIRVGVFMYVFPQDNLAILDCCDGIGRIDNNLAPSSMTLEMFCYLLCDHRIHHVPMAKNFLITEKPQLDEFKKTMLSLYRIATSMELIGGRLATLLLRYSDIQVDQDQKMRKIVKKNKKHVEKYVKKFTTCLDKQTSIDKDTEDKTMLQNEPQNDEKLLKVIEKRSLDPYIDSLVILQIDHSPAMKDRYKKEIKQVVQSIIEKTPIHAGSVKSDNPADATFQHVVYTMWAKVADSKDLHDKISKAINRITTDDAGDDFGLEDYLKEVQKQFHSIEGVEKAFKDLAKKADEEAKKKEPDTMCINCGVVNIANALLQEGCNCRSSDWSYKTITFGLHGLTIFFKNVPNGERAGLIATRAALKNEDTLKHLADPKIFKNYQRAWLVLQYAAYYGFRMELMEYNLIEKAEDALRMNRSENTTESVAIQATIYDTLGMMMFLDISSVLGLDTPPTERKKTIREEEMLELLYNFEKAAEKFMKTLKRGERFTEAAQVEEVYRRMLAYPKEHFDQSEYAKRVMIKFDELDPPVAYRFSMISLKVFYKFVAYYIAYSLISSKKKELFMPPTDGDALVVKAALKMWNNVAMMATTFKDLLKDLVLETELKAWILSIRKNLRHDNIDAVLKLANTVIYAESVHPLVSEKASQNQQDVVSHQNVHTLDEVKAQDLEKRLLENYRHIRLHILTNTSILSAVEEFSERNFTGLQFEEMESWIIHLERLLCNNVDSGDYLDKWLGSYRLASTGVDSKSDADWLGVYFLKKEKIVEKLEKIVISIDVALKNNLAAEQCLMAAQVLVAAAHLLNKLLILYQNDGRGNFFDDQAGTSSFGETITLPSPSSRNAELWKNTASIMAVLVEWMIVSEHKLYDHTRADQTTIESSKLAVLRLAFNVASTSGIDYGDVQQALEREDGKTRTTTFEQLRENEQRKIINSVKDFVEIEIHRKDGPDYRVVETLAYIIWKQQQQNRTAEATAQTFHGEIELLRVAFVNSIAVWRENVMRDHTLEKYKKQLVKKDNNEARFALPPILAQTPQRLLDEATVELMQRVGGRKAIDNVFVHPAGHTLFDGLEVPFENYESHLEQQLLNKHGHGKTVALLLVVQNPANPEAKKQILRLQDHFQRLFEAFPNGDYSKYLILKTQKNGKENKSFVKLINLKYGEQCFMWLGYAKDPDGDTYEATSSSISAAMAQIKQFVEMLNSLISLEEPIRMELHLKSSFEVVADDIGDEKAFDMCTLPGTFFGGPNASTLTSTPIHQLRSRRREMEDRGVQLQFCLIRMKLANGKIIQAVFNPLAKLNEVKLSISSHLKSDIYKLRSTDRDDLEDSSDITLQDLGLIPGAFLYVIC